MGDMESEMVTSCGQTGPPSRGIRIPTHPQNLQPKMCPAYKMYRDQYGTETEGIVNQRLVQIETYFIGQELISDTIYDTLLCLQTEASHNFLSQVHSISS